MKVDFLESQSNVGYLNMPIPMERDNQIAEVVGAIDSVEDFARVNSTIENQHDKVLRVFAERMAMRAVRENNPSYIKLGFLAVVLSCNSYEEREAQLILPLLSRAAELIDLNPDSITEEVISLVDGEAQQFLQSFLSRKDKSIESMGYCEKMDDDGFKFVRQW